MSESSVNNLNGIPNFGHGLPVDGVVIAGVTDIPQPLQDLSDNTMNDETESNVEENVPANEVQEEEING